MLRLRPEAGSRPSRADGSLSRHRPCRRPHAAHSLGFRLMKPKAAAWAAAFDSIQTSRYSNYSHHFKHFYYHFFTNLNICLQLCIYLYSIATSARHFSTLPPCTNERKQLWVFFFSFLSILLYLLLDSGNRCYECLLTHTHTTNNGPAARTVGAWPFLFLLMIIYCRYWIQIDECNEQPTSQRRT